MKFALKGLGLFFMRYCWKINYSTDLACPVFEYAETVKTIY